MLDARGLYVFTINGFPYGAFHGTRVKERVYLPDWLDEARLSYTALLGDLLAELLPADLAFGSVSTVPGAFRARVSSGSDVVDMAHRILAAAACYHGIRARTGKTIALALEPEAFSATSKRLRRRSHSSRTTCSRRKPSRTSAR